MPLQRRILDPNTSATSYRSTACRIGTHRACTESSPDLAPVDLPLIYEACDCQCHSTPGQFGPGGNAVSNSVSTGMPASDVEITERRAQG
jgi:hypothetical protein